jgi:hypothetical protein
VYTCPLTCILCMYSHPHCVPQSQFFTGAERARVNIDMPDGSFGEKNKELGVSGSL